LSKPPVDFEEVKSILLSKSIPELENLIRLNDKKSQNISMFLFWALDYFNQHPKEIPEDSKQLFIKNRGFLVSIQDELIDKELENLLSKYSQGFVLGSLEFAIREREAQINRYSEFSTLYDKFGKWQIIGFPNEDFKKQWEQRLASIEEIQDWMKSRADEWYGIILMLINSNKYRKTAKVILKTLRKGKNDDTVFQILIGVLHSNPLLHLRLEELCNKKEISLQELKQQFKKTLVFLASQTKDEKVRDLCKLFLSSKKSGGKS
jgi:glutathione peroxidase-family protein